MNTHETSSTDPAYTLVYRNDHVVVVDKAPNVLTTPSRFAESDERPCLGLRLQQDLGRRIYPVHRLDFEVSGLVLFALSGAAHSRLNSAFEHRTVTKTYEAWARTDEEGPLTSESEDCVLHWSHKLVRGKRRSFQAPHGKPASTRVVITKQHGLVKGPNGLEMVVRRFVLYPETGRPHQLRVQMALSHHHIVGDVLYGGTPWPQPGIALRAIELAFADDAIRRSFALPEGFTLPGLPVPARDAT